MDIQCGSVEGESVGRKRACRVFLGREIWLGIWAGLDARVRLVIGRGTYRVVSSPRCSQWVAEEPLRPGPSVGSEIERGEQRARGVGAWGGEKGRTGRECQFGGLLGARCAGDGAPPVGASDGWGMKGRDRRYDHVTRAGFVGSDASLTSWRVTTGRHRFGAVRCPDEDPVKLNAPAFNTGSVSGPVGLLRSRPAWSRRRYDFVLRC